MGLISLLALITMRQDFASASGADRALYVTIGKSLVALHDRTFLIGPAFCAGIGNGIILGYLMYRSALVPRNWAIFGMIAGAIALLTAVLVLFNAYDQQSSMSALLTAPEFVWEAFLGIYLTFHGFHQPSILDEAGPVSAATTV